MIRINFQKLVENNEDCTINWSSKFNSNGQIILRPSKGENKLEWQVENFLLKMTSEDLDMLFDERFALIHEPPVMMDEKWNRIISIRSMISESLENIFEAEYSKEEVTGKKPGKRLYNNLAEKFIPVLYKDIRNAMIEYNTISRSWKMK